VLVSWKRRVIYPNTPTGDFPDIRGPTKEGKLSFGIDNSRDVIRLIRYASIRIGLETRLGMRSCEEDAIRLGETDERACLE
jgi:hypothetical protein